METSYIYADSTNRDLAQYPYGNSYVLYLTSQLKCISRVKLLTAKIPNTIYNITNGSNVFSFNATSYSINTGFYSANGLAAAISNTTAAALGVQYLDDQGKFLFFASTSFTFSTNSPELLNCLGLNTTGTYTGLAASSFPVYHNDTIYFNKYLFTSDKVINLNTKECAFLDIEEFRNGNVVDSKSLNSNYSQSYVGSSIERVTGIIPLDVDSGRVKTFKSSNDFELTIELKIPVMNLQRITVQWLDKDGQRINFNGYDHNSFVLEITG